MDARLFLDRKEGQDYSLLGLGSSMFKVLFMGIVAIYEVSKFPKTLFFYR